MDQCTICPPRCCVFCVRVSYLDNPNNTYGKLVVEQQEGKHTVTTEIDASIVNTLHILERLEDKLANVEDDEQRKRSIRSQITQQQRLYQWFLNQKATGQTSSTPPATTLEQPTPQPQRGWSKYSRYRHQKY